jgi:hypothetical protein
MEIQFKQRHLHLFLVVEGGDGSQGSRRLVDGEKLLGSIFQNFVGEQRVDPAVGISRTDDLESVLKLLR